LPGCSDEAADAASGEERQETPEVTLEAGEVRETVRRVAQWALEHPFAQDPRHWSMAPLYDGLIDAGEVTGDPRFLAAVIRNGRRVSFGLDSLRYHADSHAVGYAWLRIYGTDPEDQAALLAPIEEYFDAVVDNPIVEEAPPPTEDEVRGAKSRSRVTWKPKSTSSARHG